MFSRPHSASPKASKRLMIGNQLSKQIFIYCRLFDRNRVNSPVKSLPSWSVCVCVCVRAHTHTHRHDSWTRITGIALASVLLCPFWLVKVHMISVTKPLTYHSFLQMMVRAENENGSECFEKCNGDTSSHRSWRNLWMRHSSHDLDIEFSQPAVRWCWADARPLDLILKLKGCHLIKSIGK